MSLEVILKPTMVLGVSFTGGSITVPDNATSHVGVTIATGTIVCVDVSTTFTNAIAWYCTVRTSNGMVVQCIEHDFVGQLLTLLPTHMHPVSQINDATAIGQQLVTAASATTARSVLQLGSAATVAAGVIGTALMQQDTIANARAVLQLPALGSFSLRNKVINGDFRIKQRTTAGTLPDRWFLSDNAQVSATQVAITDLPGVATGLQITAIGTGAPFALQRIEAALIAELTGSPCVVSFWAKCSANSTYVIAGVYSANAVDNFASVGNYHQVGFATSTAWTKYVCALPTLEAAYANGLQLVVGGTGAASVVTIANVQLETGTVATPFEVRNPALEAVLCKRYYEIVPVGWLYYCSAGGYWNGVRFPFQVQKRTVPTLALTVFDAVNTYNQTSFGAEQISVNGFRGTAQVMSAGMSQITATMEFSSEFY